MRKCVLDQAARAAGARDRRLNPYRLVRQPGAHSREALDLWIRRYREQAGLRRLVPPPRRLAALTDAQGLERGVAEAGNPTRTAAQVARILRMEILEIFSSCRDGRVICNSIRVSCNSAKELERLDTKTTACPRLNEATMVRLACPCCKASLILSPEGLTCQNSACDKTFPVVDGIPILIDEDKSVFAISDFMSKRDTYFPTRAPLLQGLRRLIPTISLNLKARRNYATFAGLLQNTEAKPRVLILGGSIPGEGMELLLEHTNIDFVESDIAFGPRTGIILDGHNIPFHDETFDGVIAQAVLEHVVDPYKIVGEIYRVLKADGIVYAETPFMQQVHGGAYDFTRFTHLGHRGLFRSFEELSSGAVSGTGTALAWSYKYFLMSLSNNRFVQRLLGVFATVTSFYLKYIDFYSIDNPASLDAASGVYFLGRKSTTVLSDKDLILQYRGAGRAVTAVAESH